MSAARSTDRHLDRPHLAGCRRMPAMRKPEAGLDPKRPDANGSFQEAGRMMESVVFAPPPPWLLMRRDISSAQRINVVQLYREELQILRRVHIPVSIVCGYRIDKRLR